MDPFPSDDVVTGVSSPHAGYADMLGPAQTGENDQRVVLRLGKSLYDVPTGFVGWSRNF